MEWQGINLTAFHQKQWQKRSLKNVLRLLAMLIFSFAISLILSFYYLQINEENRPVVAQIEQLNHQINQLEQQINQLKNVQSNEQINIISREKVAQIMPFIQQIPLKYGGISQVSLNNENEESIKIAGELINEKEFELLQLYLNSNKNFVTYTDSFQTSTDGRIIFSLSIKDKENAP